MSSSFLVTNIFTTYVNHVGSQLFSYANIVRPLVTVFKWLLWVEACIQTQKQYHWQVISIIQKLVFQAPWSLCTGDFCEKCRAQYCILPMTLVPVCRWILWEVRGPVLYFAYDTGSRVQVISVRSARPSTVFCLWHCFPCAGDFCEECMAQNCILSMTLVPVCRWFLWGVRGAELYFIYDTGSRVQVISVRSAGPRTVFYLWHWFPCTGDFCEECGAQYCILSMTLVPVYRWFLWGVRGPVFHHHLLQRRYLSGPWQPALL